MSTRFLKWFVGTSLVGCLGLLGFAAEDDPLRILETQRPVVTDRVKVTAVRSEDGPTDHLKLSTESRQVIELDVEGGKWGLSQQASVIYAGTREYRSKPMPLDSSDRLLTFLGIVHRVDGPDRTKEVQVIPCGFRFNEQGTGGIIQAIVLTPNKPGRYALEVVAINSAEMPQPPPTKPVKAPDWVAPLWRTSLTVVAKKSEPRTK